MSIAKIDKSTTGSPDCDASQSCVSKESTNKDRNIGTSEPVPFPPMHIFHSNTFQVREERGERGRSRDRRKAKLCFLLFFVGPRIDKPPFHPDWTVTFAYIHNRERSELTAFYTQPKWVHIRIVYGWAAIAISHSYTADEAPNARSGVPKSATQRFWSYEQLAGSIPHVRFSVRKINN